MRGQRHGGRQRNGTAEDCRHSRAAQSPFHTRGNAPSWPSRQGAERPYESSEQNGSGGIEGHSSAEDGAGVRRSWKPPGLPATSRRLAVASAGGNPNGGCDRDLAVRRVPALAEFSLDLLGIQGLAQGLGNRGAEQVTLGSLDLAGDQLSSKRALISDQVGNLSLERTQPINERAGGWVVERRNGRDAVRLPVALGMAPTPCLGLGPVRCHHHRTGPLSSCSILGTVLLWPLLEIGQGK